MKILLAAYFSLCVASTNAGEMQIVPAYPPLAEVKKLAEESVIVLICKPNATKDNLEVSVVLKGEEHYEKIRDQISDYFGVSDKKALTTEGFRAVVFIVFRPDQVGIRSANTIALWPQHDDVLANGQKIRFLSHTAKEIKKIVEEQQKRPNRVPGSD